MKSGRLIVRGWNRPRARDYYDLWNVLKNYGHSVGVARLQKTLDQKCAHRNVAYKTIDDFFTKELVDETQKHWQATLGNMVIGLPECHTVLQEVKNLIANFIG